MSIRFDSTNLRAEMVGSAHGLTAAEIKKAEPAALAAMAAFRNRWDKREYGFPGLPSDKEAAKSVTDYAASVKGSYENVLVLGIGGSALGAWALDCALRGPHPVQGSYSRKFPKLVIVDNVDPYLMAKALDSLNPRKTLVVVIAKSGNTAETLAGFLITKAWLEKAMGHKAARRIVAVTSKERGDLLALAQKEGYQRFDVPENVGGRFSVLSPVGLVPAALTRLDIGKLLKGAGEMTKLCWSEKLEDNIALRSAMLHHLVWTKRGKSIQVAFPYSNQLWGVAFWFRQLWAESLGKSKTRDGVAAFVGQTPVAALGTTDQHSQVQLYMEGPNDKVFSFWAVKRFGEQGKIPAGKPGLEAFDYLAGQSLENLLDAERRSTAAALTDVNRPNCTYTLDRVDEAHVGAFLQMHEFQTAFMGELLKINAFDQEGVELGKKYTFGLMRRPGFKEYKQRYDEYEQKQKGVK